MSESAESVVKDILIKFGLVFYRTGETIFKDFTESCLGEGATWADLKKLVDEENLKRLDEEKIDEFGKFVEQIFKNIGYDISNCESGELFSLVKSVIVKSKKLGISIKGLIDDGDKLLSNLCVNVVEKNEDNADRVLSLADVAKLGDESLGLSKYVSGADSSKGIEVGGELKALFDLVLEIVDLVKKIVDFEWKKLAEDCEDFGKFIQDKYFNEEFGRRVLDYILILLLKNAKDVFADDINSLIDDSCDWLKDLIKEKIVDSGKVDDVVDEIKRLVKQKADIENALKLIPSYSEEESSQNETSEQKESAKLNKTALSIKTLKKSTKNSAVQLKSVDDNVNPDDSIFSEKSVDVPKVQLQTALNVCKEKLNKLLEEYLPNYNSLAIIFERTYTILDLCGIIGEEPVNLLDIGFIKDANEKIKEKTSVDLIDLASGKVGTTVQIPKIRWDLLENMFTCPKSYLKEAFPLNSVEDVEKIAGKIAAVIRSFNSDFPEFKNIKQFVLDIIHRIDDRFESRLEDWASDAKREIKCKLDKFRSFLVDLLKTLERYAVEFKKTLTISFENFRNGAEKEGKNLISNLGDSVKALVESIESVDFTDSEILQSVFLDTFKDAAKKEIVKTYSGKSVEEALHLRLEELSKPYEKCKIDLKGLADKIQTDFRQSFDKDVWKKRFSDLAKDLESEFRKQTARVPDTAEELENFACESIVNLVQGKSVENVLSDFDASAYFKIVGDSFSDAITIDFEEYISSFKDIVRTFFDDFCKGLVDNIEGLSGIGDDLEKLATDILAAWLENIKQKMLELVVRPFIRRAKKIVKEWGRELIREAIVAIQNSKVPVVEPAKKHEYKEFFAAEDKSASSSSSTNLAGVVSDSAAFALDLLTLIDDVKNIDSWSDGVKFAVNLYKAIPNSIKDAVAELIDLPDIKDIIDNIHLPEYSLDTENKFFAVTLWKNKYDSNGKVVQNADISIQLAIFVGEEGTAENKTDGIYILPVVKGKYNLQFGVGENHLLKFGASAALNESTSVGDAGDDDKNVEDKLSGGKLGFFICRGDNGSGVKIKPIAEKDSASAYLELGFERKAQKENGEENIAVLVDSNVVCLTIKNYPQKVFAGYSGGAFDVGFLTSLEGMELLLKLKQLNGFFDAVLGDDIKVKIDKLALAYSLQNGLKIEDSLHIKIPFNSNIDLKVVKFKNLTLDLGLDGGDFEACLLTTFIADLKCVAFTFTDLGFGVKCNLFTPEGKAGTLKVDPKINYPTGIGISIDASAVKGAGGIQWEEKKQRFAGFLELNVLEKFGVRSMLVFTTGKGTDPFSFMGALSVQFNPGIQIGMGFSITSIGGSLGLNRGLDVDNLRLAVYDGSLSSVLFVEDIEKDFDKVLANVDKYYPILEDQMYFGLLAQISWGTILSADFGLFIQAPSPVSVIIAGLIKVRLSDSSEKLLAINANFLGGIQFDKGIFFDASLFDSKIVGISIYGDMALRIYWGGETKGFILSIGGFHPQYKPESGFNLVDMKRVGMKMDFDVVNMSLEAYFAITSNTVQFGSAFNMKIGWDEFGLTGHAAFNVLFQFNPFYFMADLSVGLAVKLFSVTLCSISLDFDLSGPAKWHASGKAKISVLLFDVSVHFDCTWGKGQSEIPLTPVNVFLLFEEEFKEDSNWKIISTDLTENLVTLLPCDGTEFVAQPSDLISFSQSKVPLGKSIDCYGENGIDGCSRIDLVELQLDSGKVVVKDCEEAECVFENASFAPSLTHRMSNEEKIAAKSYQDEISGFRLSSSFGSTESCCESFAIEEKKFEDSSNIPDGSVESYIDLWNSSGSEIKKSVKMVSSVNFGSAKKSESKNTSGVAHLFAKSAKKGSVPKVDCFNIAARLVDAQHVKKHSELISRSSLRRSATGFKRYVKQIDELIAARALKISEGSTPLLSGSASAEFNPKQFTSVIDKVVLKSPKQKVGSAMNFAYSVQEGAVTIEWITFVRLNDNKYFINKQNSTLLSHGERYCIHFYLYPKSGFAFKEIDGNAVCEVILADGTKLKSAGHMTANGKYCCHFYYEYELPSVDHIRYLSLTNKTLFYDAKLIVDYLKPLSEKTETYTSKSISKGKSVKCDLVSELNLPLNTHVQVSVLADGLLLTKTKKSGVHLKVHPDVDTTASFSCNGTALLPSITLESKK